MAEEVKSYVFPDNSANIMSMLAPLLSKSGIDASTLLAMNNNGNWGGNFMWVIFLFFLMGNNGWNGNGNNNLAGLINGNDGRNMLMQAINGNQVAINQLAASLNTSTQSINQAIYSVQSQIQHAGAQIGLTAQQTINAIQAGDASITNQIATSCCEQKLATCQQTNAITNSISQSTQSLKDAIIGKLDAMTEQSLLDKIDALRERNSNLQNEINNNTQTAIISQNIASVTKTLADAIEAVKDDVAKIKASQPCTAVVPFNPVIGVPNPLYASPYASPYTANPWG